MRFRRRRGLHFACHQEVDDLQWIDDKGRRQKIVNVEISFPTTAACAKWRLQQIIAADRFRVANGERR